jgi:acylphosphatase
VTDASAVRIRRTVHFSGRVQGVGFRYTVESLSSQFFVTGFVRNLPDGRVELVTEGPPAELERFVGQIETTMRSYVRAAETADTAATGEFSTFTITR